MTPDSPHDTARRIAASLRAAIEVELAFGTTDLLMPARSRPVPALPRAESAPAAPPPCPEPRARRAAGPATAGPAVSVPEPAPDASGPLPDTLEGLAAMVAGCTRCHLHTSRRMTVPGAGRADADLLIVGEAPGAEEDRTGVPFVGDAGMLLTRMLVAIDLSRDDVFICNTLKCRPPGNRTPDPTETVACRPYLMRQIEIVKPKVILALGTPAARALLETREGITKLRGRIFPRFGARLVPSFHPAYLLRNPRAKRESWADLRLVRRLLDEPAP